MVDSINATTGLRDKRLQKLLDKVESHLYATKKKQLFETEIRKTTREIEYIDDKIAVARKQLQKTVEANKEIEPRLHKAKRKLSRLQKERETAENEYAMLKAIEREMESKRAILPGIKKQIAHLREDIRESSARFKALQLRQRKTMAEKEYLEKETEALKTKLSGLENEIPVMRNTRDMLAGVMPEGFDADTYHTIQHQGDLESTIANYADEVNEQIERLKKEATELNTQIDEKHAREKLLLSEKENLQSKIEDIVAELGGEAKKSPILNELNRLRDKKELFVAECYRMMKEVTRLDAGIKNLDDALEQGRKLQSESMERYRYLVLRKQEMDEVDNIDAEIERLQNEIQRHNTDSYINNKLIGITNDIKQDVVSMNAKLRSAVEEYNKQFDVLVSTVHWKTN